MIKTENTNFITGKNSITKNSPTKKTSNIKKKDSKNKKPARAIACKHTCKDKTKCKHLCCKISNEPPCDALISSDVDVSLLDLDLLKFQPKITEKTDTKVFSKEVEQETNSAGNKKNTGTRKYKFRPVSQGKNVKRKPIINLNEMIQQYEAETNNFDTFAVPPNIQESNDVSKVSDNEISDLDISVFDWDDEELDIERKNEQLEAHTKELDQEEYHDIVNANLDSEQPFSVSTTRYTQEKENFDGIDTKHGNEANDDDFWDDANTFLDGLFD